MKKLVIYGSKDLGRVVAKLAMQCGYTLGGYIDDDIQQQMRGAVSYDEALIEMPPKDYCIAIAVGYNNLSARWQLYVKIKRSGYTMPNLVHPQAYVDATALLGDACVVMTKAVIDQGVCIGKAVVAWPSCVISHDSIIGSNTFLSPNCTICGLSQVGNHCFVGAGAIVADHAKVPSHSFIKAGRVFKGEE